MQNDIFESHSTVPLSERIRPKNLSDVFGQKNAVQYFSKSKDNFKPCILFGPPGSGKTTLAKAVAREFNLNLIVFNAVLQGVAELKKILHENKNSIINKHILFIDEIHRFNKAQQDALLEGLESGSLLFVGATTEKPQIALNPALISRLNILELFPLNTNDLELVLEKGCLFLGINNLSSDFKHTIAKYSDGDARIALRALEYLYEQNQLNDKDFQNIVKQFFSHSKKYDAKGTRHYDVISAFIKSLRGSDPNAAILWLAVMLDSGENPEFIARRLMIFASEDIGLASPSALMLANQAHYAVSNLGMPEARITLAHATIALSLMPKSNSAYKAIDHALEFVQNSQTVHVPNHLRNNGPEKSRYLYPHNFPNHVVSQNYVPNELHKKNFYEPCHQGHESALFDQWKKLQDKLNDSSL